MDADTSAWREDQGMKSQAAIPLLVAATLVIGANLVPRFAPAASRRAASPSRAAAATAPHSLLAGLELYQLDGPHSPIGLSVTWMGLSKVRGSFDDCACTIVFDPTDVTRSSVSILVRTPSLHTGNARRDKDLKGPDWFDVEKFPTALLQS